MATYAPVDGSRLAGALADIPAVRERLGGEPAGWRIREVGDGNLNLVFIVEGRAPASSSSRRCPMSAWSATSGRCRSSGAGSNIAR